MSDIREAFPLPVYIRSLSDDFSILQQFKHYSEIDNKSKCNSGVTYMIPLRLLELPELHGVKAVINFFFEQFIRELGVPNKIKFAMTTSWIASIKENGHVHYHNHNNCWFSGLLYFDEDYTNAAPLYLDNPHKVFSTFTIEAKEKWDFKSAFNIQPEKNLLVFFPSHLHHFSPVHTNKKTRYSLAFNFFPTGDIGEAGVDSHVNTEWLSS